MNKKTGNRTKGLTLLEILIVILILAILSSIVLVNMNSLDQQTRDTARKADIQTIGKALDLYRVYMNTYPDDLDDLTNTVIVPGSVPPDTKGPFIKTINNDPTDNQPYQYQKISDNQYILEGEATGS